MALASICRTSVLGVAVVSAMALFAGPAWAELNDPAVFELDGDAHDNTQTGTAGEGLDWQTVNATYANDAAAKTAIEAKTSCEYIARTGVIADAPVAGSDSTVFTGGRSDLQQTSLPQAAKSVNNVWEYTSGSSPDKDEITNAYALALNCDDGLNIFFGADRIATAGDAELAFWFFKEDMTPLANGTFAGHHQLGDVLVLVNFDSGKNANVGVYIWAAGAASTVGTTYKDGGTVVLDTEVPAGSANCGSGSPTNYCATSNYDNSVPLYWDYTPKGGSPGDDAPPLAFFEGGIAIDNVFGDTLCINSFLAETRASTSVTASLKDFAEGHFKTCGLSVTKACRAQDPAFTSGSDPVSTADDRYLYYLSGTVTSQRGSIYNVSIVEDDGDGVYDSTKDTTVLASGLTATTSGTSWGDYDLQTTVDAPTDKAFAVGTLGTDPGSTQVVSDISNLATCPNVSPPYGLTVTKKCLVCLGVDTSGTFVTVQSTGKVKNTGDVPLTGVTVVDDRGTTDTSDDETIDIGTLTPGQEETWTGTSYSPTTLNNTNPDSAEFSDTASASGTAGFGIGTVTAGPTNATCPLCLDGATNDTGLTCPALTP